MVQCFNSFLASGNFCRLLIAFENSLDPDQDRHFNFQTVSHSDSVSERIFENINFANISRRQKSM